MKWGFRLLKCRQYEVSLHTDLSLILYFFGFHSVCHRLWKRLGTNGRNGGSVCSRMAAVLLRSEMWWDSWRGWSAVRTGYGLSRKDRLGWWGVQGVVVWSGLFVFFLWEHCGSSLSSAFWVDEESAESLWVRISSRSARVMLVGIW